MADQLHLIFIRYKKADLMLFFLPAPGLHRRFYKTWIFDLSTCRNPAFHQHLRCLCIHFKFPDVKMFFCIIHQLFRICPLIAPVVRPAAAKQCHHKGSAFAFQCPNITVTCLSGKSSLSGQCPFHHIEECIVIVTAVMFLLLYI